MCIVLDLVTDEFASQERFLGGEFRKSDKMRCDKRD